MSRKKCADCFYYDVCTENEVCGDFDPITEIAKTLCLAEEIRKDRRRFYYEWKEYIRED